MRTSSIRVVCSAKFEHKLADKAGNIMEVPKYQQAATGSSENRRESSLVYFVILNCNLNVWLHYEFCDFRFSGFQCFCNVFGFFGSPF